MAGVRGSVSSGEVTTGVAVKTILQLVAAANHRVLLRGFYYGGKGVTAADPAHYVELLRQTTAGTMSAATPVKLDSTDDETLQTTAQHTATVEPTAGDILRTMEIHPQGSNGMEWFPFDQPIVIPGGTRLGLRTTATVSISVNAVFVFEE